MEITPSADEQGAKQYDDMEMSPEIDEKVVSVKVEPLPMKPSIIEVGTIVQSIYGKGKQNQSEMMECTRSKSWLLANHKAPTFYMMKGTLLLQKFLFRKYLATQIHEKMLPLQQWAKME